jgi:hypothetical protein
MSHWTTERQKIHDWIAKELELPIFADAYRGAVDCLYSGSPGYVTFVCHTCRDIMNIMAREYSGGTAGRVDYNHHATAISAHWSKQSTGIIPITGLTDAAVPDQVPISRKAFNAVGGFVQAYQEGTLRAEDSGSSFFCTFFDSSDRQSISEIKLNEWKETLKWFKAHAHLRKSPFSSDIAAECQRRFLILEGLLLTAADSVRDRLQSLNEILRQTNQ